MTKDFKPKVVTANALLEGDAVWLTKDDRWSRRMTEAELIEDPAHAELRMLHAESQAHVVVGPYLVDASPGPEGPQPTHFRETFRTRGPSNHAHGKQVELNDV